MSAAPPALGFGLPVSGSWASPEVMVELARTAEDLGYTSLWAFQRLLSPVDAAWGQTYRSVLDPLVALGYAAAVTERIRLGVAVLNAPFVSPIVLAKQLTTVDVVSGGRLDVGLGLGWATEEFRATGVPFTRRGARTEETVRCLKALWGRDPVSFAGDFFDVPVSSVQPKPVQVPHPPVLLGGTAEPALRRAGRVADGWISASRHDLRTIGDAVSAIRSAAQDAGRDPGRLRFVVRGVVRLGDELTGRDGVRRPLTGSAGQVHEDLEALGEQGVTEVFLDLNFDPRVGSPDAEAAWSVAYAHEVLEALAPR